MEIKHWLTKSPQLKHYPSYDTSKRPTSASTATPTYQRKYVAKSKMALHKHTTSPASSTLMKGNYAMEKTNRTRRQDPSYKELAYWKDTAAKRMRFAWATGIFGGMVGFIFHWVISMPPVWM